MNAFVAFRVWLQLVEVLSEDNAMQLYVLSRWVKAVVTGSSKVLLLSPATSYFVPMFIWMLVTFRRDDLSVLLSTSKTNRPATP